VKIEIPNDNKLVGPPFPAVQEPPIEPESRSRLTKRFNTIGKCQTIQVTWFDWCPANLR
jgi:hypothetical protein